MVLSHLNPKSTGNFINMFIWEIVKKKLLIIVKMFKLGPCDYYPYLGLNSKCCRILKT